MLTDNHNRPIQYLRLAITDRCNLRCFYCMPENMQFVQREDLLSYEEMLRLTSILSSEGISKVRITGGEPFVRKDLMVFLKKLTEQPQIDKVEITTNGVLTWKYLKELMELGINSFNLSLDTLDRNRFFEITRRDVFEDVIKTLDMGLELGFKIKINAVVMDGKNTKDIIPLANYAKDHPVDIRFIEEMPFNGVGAHYSTLTWNHKKIKETLSSALHLIRNDDPKGSTAETYSIDGFEGTVGIIPAYTRTFCSDCNRIRITALGMLKNCLYDDGVFNLRDFIRRESDDQVVRDKLVQIIQKRPKNGFEAEKNRVNKEVHESMSTIGG